MKFAHHNWCDVTESGRFNSTVGCRQRRNARSQRHCHPEGSFPVIQPDGFRNLRRRACRRPTGAIVFQKLTNNRQCNRYRMGQALLLFLPEFSPTGKPPCPEVGGESARRELRAPILAAEIASEPRKPPAPAAEIEKGQKSSPLGLLPDRPVQLVIECLFHKLHMGLVAVGIHERIWPLSEARVFLLHPIELTVRREKHIAWQRLQHTERILVVLHYVRGNWNCSPKTARCSRRRCR
jgi:hypothetical protein